MEGKGSLFNIVLLVILAFLSLTVCILAGYVFFGGGGSKASPTAVSNTQTVKDIPKESDLLEKYVFGSEEAGESKIFNLKKVNNSDIAVIKVMIKLKYMKKIKGIKDTTAKLQSYDSEIKSLIGTYFMNMTTAEASDVKTKKKVAPEELKKEINELLSENEETKTPIVYEVIFEEWFYQ